MHRGRSPVAGLVPLVVAVSACLGGGALEDSNPTARVGGPRAAAGEPLGIPADWAELALPSEPGHVHNDPKQHANLSTPNFEIIGYDPLITDYYGKTAGSYFCGNTVEREGRRLSVVHSFGSDVAFILVDTTDLRNPQKIGEFVMGNTQTYDLAITPDLQFVLLGTSPLDSGPDDPTAGGDEDRLSTILFRDACTGEERPVKGPEQGLPWASGIVLVDISNPRVPAIVDFRIFPLLGTHSVRVGEFDGRTLILSSVAGTHPGGYYVLMDIQQIGGGPKLNLLSAYHYLGEDQGGPPNGLTGGCGPHDGYMQKHPATGELLAYLAYSCSAFIILNIDDAENPRFVSRWADWSILGGKTVPVHHIHEALPIEGTWEGRHYTFIGEECVSRTVDVPSCMVYALDTTEPAKPGFVGAWTLPVDVQWSEGLVFSLHYLALSGRTLFVTAYHGGVWAIDVSSLDAMQAMPAIGVFLPTLESPKPAGTPPRSIVTNLYFRLAGNTNGDWTPLVGDLDVAPDGTLIVWDGMSGIYSVLFDATRPAPPPKPWPLGYNEVAG